ncbi:NAD-dependent epimerase/dehydratase family protein [Nonomuraea sp. NPDC050547]|uniref:NAD-dependent epimerase/dehydratase family protein n=1 Tax=unclassified Nonomuraea TaxID=2593643 RepID=UPI0037ABC56B
MTVHQRVVISGGAGFVGSHLCERFVDNGAQVVCLDNYTTGRLENVAHLLEAENFEAVACDVTEPVRVNGPVDLVMHLASPASPKDYLLFPVETLQVGSTGTRNMLDLAHEKRARFVFASSSEVYGDPFVHPQREDYWGNVNPVGPRSVYDEAKRFSEALATAYRNTKGTDTGIVRIFNTYGPRMRPDDGRAIPTFICQALRGEPLTVTGDGTQTRSVCYVDDLVEGLLALAMSAHPGPINLGNPEELKVLDIAHRIAGHVGMTPVVRFIDRPIDDPHVRRPDTTLARAVLGWNPVTSFEVGLKRTIEWFSKQLEFK